MGMHGSCFSRCFRDSCQERETGIRGIQRLKVWGETNRTVQLLMTPKRRRGGGKKKVVSPSTWNIDGSSQVYFCQLHCLPSALSDGQLLCCLTRKDRKKARRRWGGRELAWELFPTLGVLSPGDEAFSEAGMWWSCVDERQNFRL